MDSDKSTVGDGYFAFNARRGAPAECTENPSTGYCFNLYQRSASTWTVLTGGSRVGGFAVNKMYNYKIVIVSSTDISFYQDDVIVGSSTSLGSGVLGSPVYLVLSRLWEDTSTSATSNILYDNIRARSYASSEPTHSVPGDEETN